jgi:hypothetical protein
VVGANGFEPSTSWSRTRRSSQAEPRPDRHAHPYQCLSANASLTYGIAVRSPKNSVTLYLNAAISLR